MNDNKNTDALNHENSVSDAITQGDNSDAPQAQIEATTGHSGDGAGTFPREYVESLRKESAGYRERAKLADERSDGLAARLHTALVAATGRLENPADLTFDTDHLDSATALTDAIDALLTDRPYLAKRTVAGDAGQGERGNAEASFSLLDALKGLR